MKQRVSFAISSSLLAVLVCSASSFAGLPDRYIGDTSIYSGTTVKLRPNVLFIVDTSKNMMQGGGTEPYDPGTTYPGSYSSNGIYKQLNAGQFQAYVDDVNAMGCAEAKAALIDYGFYNKGIAKTSGNCSTKKSDVGNYYLGNLLNKTQSQPPPPATWAGNTAYAVGDVVTAGDTSNANTYRCIQAGTSGGTEPAWPLTAGGQVTDGTVVWEITSTLMDVVKEVLKQASGVLRDDIKLGLMTVGGNNSGGYVRAEVKKIAETDTGGETNFQALLQAIDNLATISSNVSQPVNESLYDAMFYYKGQNDSNLKQAAGAARFSAPSPIEFTCQKNYTIILTTGSSTASPQMVSAVGDQNGDGLSGRVDDVAKLLYETDMLSGMDGTQRVQTSVIQLMTSYVEELEQTTNGSHGRGSYSLANNTEELIYALLNMLSNIVREAESAFVAPVVPASPENRTYSGKRIYIGFFKPISQKPWYGNLKKFAIDSLNRIVSADGTTLATNTDGTFNAAATSYWSPAGDAGIVDKGGVGGKLMSRAAARKIWTWTGDPDKRAMTDEENLFVVSNTAEALSAVNLDVSDAERTKLIKYVQGFDGYNDDGQGDTAKREWVMGDILHSKPLVVSYKKFALTPENEANPEINKTFIFQGGNDGMLHAFSDADGEEEWAFIPPDLLPRLNNLREPTHSYFVDGTPSIYIHDANNDLNIVKADGDRAILIFGLRRGGGLQSLSESGSRGAYYALDVSDPTAPEFLWKIDSTTTGFSELAQSWSQPRLARVKVGTARKIVAFVGAGYDNVEDLRYGSTQTYPVGATETGPTDDFSEGKSSAGGAGLYPRGRGIYAIEVATLSESGGVFSPNFSTSGTLVWGITYGATEGYGANIRTSPQMTFSIPSDIAAMDRDRDGFVDRLYVGDLGGNLWAFNTKSTDVAQWSAKKVFSSNPGSDGTNGRKIFYKPDAVLLDSSNVMLYFGTGDREHPMNYKDPGSSGAVIDRLYAVRDSDNQSVTLTESNLHNVTENKLQQDIDSVLIKAERDAIYSPNNYGWYIKLNVNPGEKALAPVSVFSHIGFYTTYQPDTAEALAEESDPCDPGNLGSSRLYAVDIRTGEAVFNFNTVSGLDQFGENQTSASNAAATGKDKDGNTYVLRRADRELSLGGGIPSGMVFIFGADGSVSAITAANIAFPVLTLPGKGTIFPVYWTQW